MFQDEEFSSLNSTSTTENYSAKALAAEFIEWLDFIDNRLDSMCYCAKIASPSHLTSVVDTTVSDNNNSHCQPSSDEIPVESQCDNQRSDVDYIVSEDQLSGIDEEEEVEEEENISDNHDDKQVSEDDVEDPEAEELAMSLLPVAAIKAKKPYTNKSSIPETLADWSVILARHKVSDKFIILIFGCRYWCDQPLSWIIQK